jgi:hypothetical protein
MREVAQTILLKAEERLYLELDLPEIDEDNVHYFVVVKQIPRLYLVH